MTKRDWIERYGCEPKDEEMEKRMLRGMNNEVDEFDEDSSDFDDYWERGRDETYEEWENRLNDSEDLIEYFDNH